MDKKGISDLVSVVLIVLITITAVAFIANLIIPFVSNNLKTSSECVNVRGYFSFDDSQGYDCYDSSGLYGFSIKGGSSNVPDSGANISVIGFAAVLSKPDGSTSTLRVINGNLSSGAVGGVRMLNSSIANIYIPGNNEVQTYVYNAGATMYTQMDIYPIIASGKICDKSATATFLQCTGVTSLTP